jgi:hypothetical protein
VGDNLPILLGIKEAGYTESTSASADDNAVLLFIEMVDKKQHSKSGLDTDKSSIKEGVLSTKRSTKKCIKRLR